VGAAEEYRQQQGEKKGSERLRKPQERLRKGSGKPQEGSVRQSLSDASLTYLRQILRHVTIKVDGRQHLPPSSAIDIVVHAIWDGQQRSAATLVVSEREMSSSSRLRTNERHNARRRGRKKQTNKQTNKQTAHPKHGRNDCPPSDIPLLRLQMSNVPCRVGDTAECSL
jgi:hypothetical protein